LPKILQKLIEWFPSTKEYIDEYYPESGTELSLLDAEIGKQLWDCRRTFYGSYDLSPNGNSLAISFTKDDSIIVEMWDTHYPRRWLEVLGFICLVGLWYWWRGRKAPRRAQLSSV